MLNAKFGGHPMLRGVGFMRGLNRLVDRIFDQSRKEPRWGR